MIYIYIHLLSFSRRSAGSWEQFNTKGDQCVCLGVNGLRVDVWCVCACVCVCVCGVWEGGVLCCNWGIYGEGEV